MVPQMEVFPSTERFAGTGEVRFEFWASSMKAAGRVLGGQLSPQAMTERPPYLIRN